MIGCFAAFLVGVIAVLALGRNLLWAIFLGLALFFLLGLRRGHSSAELWKMAWKKGRESLIVVPVFLMIGTVTALWRASGTISFFLYYGLRGIHPACFLLTVFLLSAILSFALGTSYGVCGTAGVVLMALARGGGVQTALAAGAVLSGAYFGDRCSPMSSCAMLVAACTGTELYKNVREMLRTAALPTVLAVLFYAVLSGRHPIEKIDPRVLHAISTHFSMPWFVLLPAVFVLVLPLLRVPVKWALSASALTAFCLSVFLQHLPVLTVLRTALLGYLPAAPELCKILAGGGLVSMLSASTIVFVTSLYSGILEGIDALSPAKETVDRLAEKIGLFPTAALVSTVIVGVFCNQSVMVIMDEQLLRGCYKKRGASSMERAMDIANSGVTLAGLVPWSIALTVPLTMLGADLSAVPYAVLLYFIPLCYLFTRKFFLPAQRAGMRARS